jgi:hypothetical protein
MKKANPFEKSGKDKEGAKYGKEGSKGEEAFDRKQAGKAPAKSVKAAPKMGRKGC